MQKKKNPKKNKKELLDNLIYSRKGITKLDHPEEAMKLPYVKHVPKDGRAISNYSFYDNENKDWILHLPIKQGKLARIAGGKVVVGGYLASEPEHPEQDLIFPLGTFIIQHLSFRKLINILHGLESDFHNFSSILEKYLLISLRPKEQRDGAGQLLAAELEYLIVCIRSMYDLLQKISKSAAALIRDIHEPHDRIVMDLPDSFAKIVMHGSHRRSKDELVEHYQLPPPLAEFYFKESEHFLWLRELRVAIEHHGKSPGMIFDIEDGMAIKADEKPWPFLPIWKPKLLGAKELGSLRAVFLYLVSQALELTTRYTRTYLSCIAVPPAIGHGYNFYVRDYFSHHLVSLTASLKHPWERAVKSNAP